MDDNIKGYIETESKLKELNEKQKEIVESLINEIKNKLSCICKYRQNIGYGDNKRIILFFCGGKCDISIQYSGTMHYSICSEQIDPFSFNNNILESNYIPDYENIDDVINHFLFDISKHLPNEYAIYINCLRTKKLENILKDEL